MAKSVLITGCSSGIGAAAARHFSGQGWKVAATMRKPADGAALAALPGVRVLALDVTDDRSVRDTVAQVLKEFGALDAVVNNAGFGVFGPFEPASQALIDRQFGTNVFGVFNVTRAALPAMRAARRGVIVNVTSIGGLLTLPLNSIYHATKFAVDGFSESLRYELEPFGIAVKVVAPGGVATDFASRSLAVTFEGDGGPYADTVAKVTAAFTARRGNYSTAASIAEVIYRAATDGTNQIRYIAGPDAEEAWAARKSVTEDQFFQAMKGRFGLGK